MEAVLTFLHSSSLVAMLELNPFNDPMRPERDT